MQPFKYKDKLSKRNKAETETRNEWYALQRCVATYYKEYKKEKIVYGQFKKINLLLIHKKIFFILK